MHIESQFTCHVPLTKRKKPPSTIRAWSAEDAWVADGGIFSLPAELFAQFAFWDGDPFREEIPSKQMIREMEKGNGVHRSFRLVAVEGLRLHSVTAVCPLLHTWLLSSAAAVRRV
jgi:hypothetical protein